MIILEPGEKDIRHNVSKANSLNSPRQATQLEASDLTDEFRLIPWIKWMEKVDFDSRWDKNA
jgi:hypothetical protein